MKKQLLKLAALAAMALGTQAALAQAPQDNPYRTQYNPAGGHWTDSLRWYYVRPVTDFGAVANDGQDDYAAIQAGIDTLHAAGGGVLFFPAGMFNSSESIKIKSGVLLRGETPAPGADDPMQTSYAPPSQLWFPQYIFDTTANGGAGTANSTAFKIIEAEYGSKNTGVINLDVNRAMIKFQPDYTQTPPAGFSTVQPINELSNVIVYGVRSNNAVLPDPAVPTTQQKPWQRFVWRFSCNIDVMVKANALVARNRLNDGVPKDNFLMEGYVIEFRGSGGWKPLTLAQRPLFDYDAHYAITVNRKKTYRRASDNTWAVGGYDTYGTPETEPTLFAPNIQILDNWMFKNNRVAIMGSGNGLTIKGNVMKDDITKQSRDDYMGPTGRLTPQGATTFENRGIDFSGWHALIEGNDVEAYRHRTGSYLSTDGEGILVQECCGGTSVNDYIIRNNYMRTGNYIGIYKMRDCHNVHIENNDMRSASIQITANTNGGTYQVHNCSIRNNTNTSSLLINGSVGGTNTFIEGNQGSSTISAPCYAVVQNNTGYSGVTYNSGGGVPCQPTANFPAVALRGTPDSTFCPQAADSILLVKATLAGGDITLATIDIYLGSQLVAQGLVPDLIDSAVRYYYTLPKGNGLYNFTARVRQGSNVAYSATRSFEVNCPVSNKPLAGNLRQQLTVHPNPGSGMALVSLPVGEGTLTVTDLSGRQLMSLPYAGHDVAQPMVVDMHRLEPGLYIIGLQSAQGFAAIRYVKQ